MLLIQFNYYDWTVIIVIISSLRPCIQAIVRVEDGESALSVPI